MDINLLVVSCGNSRTALAAFIAGDLERIIRVDNGNSTDIAAAVAELWELLRNTEEPAVAGATVNPPMIESIEHTVKQITRHEIEWVGKTLDLPIKVLTDSPEQTGVDRVLSVAAAFEQLSKACVVVDAGTAITVNFCNETGAFVGGAIAPGLRLQLQSLHTGTARLPDVPFERPVDDLGKNTEQAIRLGVLYGIRGMVQQLVESYATTLGAWPEVIATGGDARILFEDWEIIHAISPDLTVYGIALAYTNHYIKHGH